MGDEPYHNLRPMHSHIMQSCKSLDHAKNLCKSEIINVVPNQQTNYFRTGNIDVHSSCEDQGEYYKKYEHDELPVKDSNLKHILPNIRHKGSLTNSELDKWESKIFKNISQQHDTNDNNSKSSLESNIKIFRTTVLEIFDNFFRTMQDFKVYKRRFNEILEKNKEDATADMEDFIKDMIQHITSSETLLSAEGRKTNELASLKVRDKERSKTNDQASMSLGDKNIDGKDGHDEKFTDIPSLPRRAKQTNVSNCEDESSYNTNNSGAGNLHSFVEAYKNDNYLTVSTIDGNPPKDKASPSRDEIFNIFLLSGHPCVQSKINDRNLLSEINIKEAVKDRDSGKYVASAENMQRLAAKKRELEKYVNVEQDHDTNEPDREIPVKVSYAKKNIYLDEDFAQERDTEKSFIAKLCNVLCKKIRKNY